MTYARNLQQTYADCGDPDRFATSTICPESEVANILISHNVGAGASAVWPTANTVLFFPFTVTGNADEAPRAYSGVIVMNGAAVSGNIQVGIYDALGNKIAATASTAQAGTTAPQRINFATPVQLIPGRYYLAVGLDNGVGALVRWAPTAQVARGAGVRSLATFYPMTASAAAWVGTSAAYVPWVTLVESTVS